MQGLGPFCLFLYQLKNTTRYSWAGFTYLFKTELAAKVESVFFIMGVIIYFVLGVSAKPFLISVGLFVLLVAVEALNTAIEMIVDEISPHETDLARHAKDLACFAVVCLIGITLFYVGWVVYTHL